MSALVVYPVINAVIYPLLSCANLLDFYLSSTFHFCNELQKVFCTQRGTAVSSAQFPVILPGTHSCLQLSAKYSVKKHPKTGTLIQEACSGKSGLTLKLLQLQSHKVSDEAESV